MPAEQDAAPDGINLSVLILLVNQFDEIYLLRLNKIQNNNNESMKWQYKGIQCLTSKSQRVKMNERACIYCIVRTHYNTWTEYTP